MQYKLRNTVASKERDPVFALTVPKEIAVFFEGTLFTAHKSGTCIVFYSGTSIVPREEDLNEYQYEDCRIKAE